MTMPVGTPPFAFLGGSGGMSGPKLATAAAAPGAASYGLPAAVLYPSTPILQQWHVWWAGTLLGWAPPPPGAPALPTSAWSLTELTGWTNLPDSDPRNTIRQARWGEFSGLQTFGSRTIEATFEYTGYGNQDSLHEIRRTFTPQEDPPEQPLWIWAGTKRPEFVMARVDKASIPSDQDFSLGYHRITIAWVATDPIRYGEEEFRAEAPLPPTVKAEGLKFPLNFNPPTGPGLDFAKRVGGGGVVPVTNTGLLNVWPHIQVLGPLTGPSIEHIETGKLIAFSEDLVLGAGETLEIDTNHRYASQGGISRAHMMTSRQWFQIPAGYSRFRFAAASSDPAAKLIVTWRTAAII